MASVFKFSFLLVLLNVLFCTASFAQNTNANGKPLNWVPWSQISVQTQRYVYSVNTSMNDLVGDGSGIYVSAVDINFDKQSEVILSFRRTDDCGVDGCLFVVIDGKSKQLHGYVGNILTYGRRKVFIDGLGSII